MVGSDSCSGFPFAPSGTSCPSADADFFITKFSADGVLEYANIYNGSGMLDNPDATEYRGGDILCDANNNLYIYAEVSPGASITLSDRSGYYFDNASPSSICSGCHKCAILELDTSQTLIWGTLFGEIDGNSPGGMALDRSGNIYICGTTGTNQDHASCSDN